MAGSERTKEELFAIFADGQEPGSITPKDIRDLVESIVHADDIESGSLEGLRGEQGPQGERGPAGLKGDQGQRGDEGPQGEQGAAGPAGPQGPAGAAGASGPAGPAGPRGNDGSNGSQGLQGEQGPQGPQGLQGDQGPAGLKGDTGAVGAEGPQGPAGTAGINTAVVQLFVRQFSLPSAPSGNLTYDFATGLATPLGGFQQSPPASNGDPLWLVEALVISNSLNAIIEPSDWASPIILALDGNDGAQGPIGPRGPEGPQGDVGPEGPQGPQGPAGSGSGGGAASMQLSNSDTATDLNQTAFTTIPMAAGLEVGSGFTQSGSGIQADFTGHVELSANVFLFGTSQRPTITCTFYKNGVDTGLRFNSDYIRGTAGVNESSNSCPPFLIACSPGDVFTLQGRRDGATGTVTMSGAGSSFFRATKFG